MEMRMVHLGQESRQLVRRLVALFNAVSHRIIQMPSRWIDVIEGGLVWPLSCVWSRWRRSSRGSSSPRGKPYFQPLPDRSTAGSWGQFNVEPTLSRSLRTRTYRLVTRV